jgi:hypothetical protein
MGRETTYYSGLLTPRRKIEIIGEKLGEIRNLLEDISDELYDEEQ